MITGLEEQASRKVSTIEAPDFDDPLLIFEFEEWRRLPDPQVLLTSMASKGQTAAAILPAFDTDQDWFVISQQLGPSLAHVNFGLSMDAARLLNAGRRPSLYRRVNVDKLFHVSLGDRSADQACLPGLGDLNLAGLVRLLARKGYTGPWSVAVPEDVQGADGALEANRALRNLLHAVAQDTPALARTLLPIPPKAKGKGLEFVEFAVDAHGQIELETQLRALKFRKERVHKHKPVTLWRQGAINLVLNQAPTAARKLPQGSGPFVCDMGIRVGDGVACVDRSQAMGATPFASESNLDEVLIPAIAEDSGSLVHFVDERTQAHRVWDLDFVAQGEPWPGQPAGLRRIDHLAQTYRTTEMRRWMLFYLSTFDMRARSPFEVHDPAGQVSSRAIETPEGEIRLTLNGTDNQDTQAGKFIDQGPATSVQHIAFLTDDIFETSDLIQEAGFQRLEIEGSYYDQLVANYELSEQEVARLRAANILYSEDAQGHFYQIYSKPFRGGLFFEIVQRVDGYAGYGSANAAVRLRAQSRL